MAGAPRELLLHCGMITGLVADALVQQHQTPPGHPESPARFEAVRRGLQEAGLMEKLVPLAARDATLAELQLVHTSAYLHLVETEILNGRAELSMGDTAVCAQSLTASRRAAGAVFSAMDAVITGRVENAFCALRPPGHHASAGRGMGFCIFNNVALAARYAQQQHGVKKVLIVDWDVHHGNGTQDIFYEDGSVLFFSTHQAPWYPGTGAQNETGRGSGRGTTINCPLPAGAGRAEIFAAWENFLLPAADHFQPELVLISAGFDAHAGDPLGDFRLTEEDFFDLTKSLLDLASKHAAGRVVSVLEGGYNLETLARAASAHVQALLNG